MKSKYISNIMIAFTSFSVLLSIAGCSQSSETNFSSNPTETSDSKQSALRLIEASEDYDRFLITPSEFYDFVEATMETDSKPIEMKKINFSDEYNLQPVWFDDCNYSIELKNGDRILFQSTDPKVGIEKIAYDSSKNVDGGDAGYFTGSFASFYSADGFDVEEYVDEMSELLKKPDTFDFNHSQNSNLVHNHLFTEIGLHYGSDPITNKKDFSKQYLFFNLKPVAETETKAEENNDISTSSSSIKDDSSELEIIEKPPVDELENTSKVEEPVLEPVEFSAGYYTVGEDLPAGKYNLIAVSGSGNCYISRKVNEIFSVEPNEHYIDRFNNAKLTAGDEINIKSSLVLRFEPVQ